jgi:hypothetical protein
MIEQRFMSFTLVPQTDRRQVADRRAVSRGGRRASDVINREQLLTRAQTDASVLWTGSSNDVSRTEKLRLN